jgi:hypothetical protein
VPGGPLILSAALAQPEVPEGWRAAAFTSRTGLGLLAVGAVVDGSVGVWQLTRGTTPLLDGLHTGSATALGVGIGLVGLGGLQAAYVVRRAGEDCPTWAGWTGLGLEIVGVGLVLAEPLPAWADWIKLIALPFAVLQVDQSTRAASRRWPDLPGRHPLLALQVSPTGVQLVGAF